MGMNLLTRKNIVNPDLIFFHLCPYSSRFQSFTILVDQIDSSAIVHVNQINVKTIVCSTYVILYDFSTLDVASSHFTKRTVTSMSSIIDC